MIYRTVFQERALGSVIFFMALGLCLFHMPFIACNFHYYFEHHPCTYLKIENFKIVFNLRTWLIVDAFVCMSFLGILLILALISCLSIDKPNYLTAYTIVTTIFGIFRIIWLIIGAIMFWGELYPKKVCSVGFANYMWANLIIGFIGAAVYYAFGYTYPRIQSVPLTVKVPQANMTSHPTNIQLQSNNGMTTRGDPNPYILSKTQHSTFINPAISPRSMNNNTIISPRMNISPSGTRHFIPPPSQPPYNQIHSPFSPLNYQHTTNNVSIPNQFPQSLNLVNPIFSNKTQYPISINQYQPATQFSSRPLSPVRNQNFNQNYQNTFPRTY